MESIPGLTRLISWNVNGLRAVLSKGFPRFVCDRDPDTLCLQEIKAHPDQVEEMAWSEGYHGYWNPAERKGYSGTAVFARHEPLAVSGGIGIPGHDTEGRVLTLEYPRWFLVNVYTPNAQNELRRLPYRQKWDRDFLAYLRRLERTKPVVVCGDFNVAHKEIDIARPKANRRNPGFTDEERAGFDALVAAGFVDTFREFCSEPGHYTWWSYRANARAKNIGWRIDYWCVSEPLRPLLKESFIHRAVEGSDHCPIELVLDT